MASKKLGILGKKQTAAIGVAMIIMVSGMGVSYAYWVSPLSVKATITTGQLKGSVEPAVSNYGLVTNKQITFEVENTGDVAWVLDTQNDMHLSGVFEGVIKDDLIFEDFVTQIAVDGQETHETSIFVPIGSRLTIHIDFETELTEKLATLFQEDFVGLEGLQIEANMTLRNIYGAQEGWSDTIDQLLELSAQECLGMMPTKPQGIMPVESSSPEVVPEE